MRAPSLPTPRPLGRTGRIFLLVIVLATVIAYENTFRVPFVFDDGPAITNNGSLRDLSRIGQVLWPRLSGGETVRGRPLVNLSLAINYALSGKGVWSYHATNLLIHLLAGLLLFGLVRQTLLLPSVAPRFGDAADSIALATMALWILHPLQPSAVTYIAQRAESLTGLFFLLTVYTFARAATSVR